MGHILMFGAPSRNRTCDLRIRNPSLYPLSYGGGTKGLKSSLRKGTPASQ